ncbi:MAG: tRNA pseudouridine synthase A [Eubacteriales bacterium]
MKLLLKIRYDGTAYCGYQAQPDQPSIQRTLTDAAAACFGFPCTVTGCSRTDAGVHALGFCAAVEPVSPENRIPVPTGRVHRALRCYLPPDISICGEAEAADDFHPRYSAVRKEYLYRMYDTVYDDPFLLHRAWRLRRPVTDDGLAAMNRAAAHLVGTHDFTSFMAAGSRIVDAHRTVDFLTVQRNGAFLDLRVAADGFLYHMVRILAGTLADCADGVLSPDDLPAILEARNRGRAGKTAPAYGLYLAEVTYDRKIEWKIL